MSNPLYEEPKPGYLTSEFWSTLLVHGLVVATTLLDLLHVHWSKGLSGTEAAVPVIALVISATLQAAYHDKRVAVKMDHTAQVARTYIAELENGYHQVEPEVTAVANTVHNWSSGADSGYVSTVVKAVAPEEAPLVEQVQKVADAVATGVQKADAALQDVVPEAPAAAPKPRRQPKKAAAQTAAQTVTPAEGDAAP